MTDEKVQGSERSIENPGLSVVLPVYNEEDAICKVIETMHSRLVQYVPNFEYNRRR